jgi:predicted transcriptional regulator
MNKRPTKKTYTIWERRVRVAELYLEGKPQPQIAKILGINQAMVSRDLASIREEWLKSSVRDFETSKAQEIAKIDRLEEQAWDAWHRSTQEQRTTVNKTESMRRTVQGGKRGAHKLVPTKVTENVTVKNCPGDPRFMETIAWCIETRLKVLGAFKETTNINNLVIDWGKMVMQPDYNPTMDVDVIESKIAQASLPLPQNEASIPIAQEESDLALPNHTNDGRLHKLPGQELVLNDPDRELLDGFDPDDYEEGELVNERLYEPDDTTQEGYNYKEGYTQEEANQSNSELSHEVVTNEVTNEVNKRVTSKTSSKEVNKELNSKTSSNSVSSDSNSSKTSSTESSIESDIFPSENYHGIPEDTIGHFTDEPTTDAKSVSLSESVIGEGKVAGGSDTTDDYEDEQANETDEESVQEILKLLQLSRSK